MLKGMKIEIERLNAKREEDRDREVKCYIKGKNSGRIERESIGR